MAEEQTYSIDDIIQGEVELEQEVNVILGSTSDQKCTYDGGYIYRQPVFSCITCSDKNETKTGLYPGGICLACSLKCHATHEVEELYTKRDFRCDCGNKSKFGHLGCILDKCLLQPNKSDSNPLNVYSDNFKSLYCVCKKVYDGDSEMIQCVLCEDWFHIGHCGVESTEHIDEFVCQSCMSRNPILYNYVDAGKTIEAMKKADCDESSVPKEEGHCVQDNIPVGSLGSEGECVCVEKPVENIPERNQLKRKTESFESESKRAKPATACKLDDINQLELTPNNPGIFSQNWRENLCQCESCLEIYKNNKIEFLLRTTDTIEYYEQQAKDLNSFTDGVDAFSKLLNHTQKLELTYQFNSMKAELSEFLRPFATEGKAVGKEDIHRFFEELTKKKETFDDIGIPPDSCK